MTKNSNNDNWAEFKERLEHLKEIVDPRYLVESLGFKVERETVKEVRSTCKIHGGDNRTAFRFNKQSKTWVCFSHKCHDIFGNDIIGLIKGAQGLDFLDSVRYLKELAGEVDSVKSLEYKRKKEKEEFINLYKETKPASSIVTEECLVQFKSFRSKLFIDDGFTKETLDFFEIAGGYTDSFGYIRDIIPIRDEKGKLVAYSCRDIRKNVEDDDFKYILTRNFNKDLVLYNLYNAKNYVKDKPLIIVEGFKSVWRLYQYGIKNVIAVMGSSIGPGQRNLLYSHALNGVVIVFDNDIPGIEGCYKACGEMKDRMDFIVPIFITEIDEKDKGLDPSDLSKEQVYSYLEPYIKQ